MGQIIRRELAFHIRKMKLSLALLLGADALGSGDASQCESVLNAFPDCKCMDIAWKGSKVSKSLAGSAESELFQIAIANNADGVADKAFNIRDPTSAKYTKDYTFFMIFKREFCGIDFLHRVGNGDIKFNFMDHYAAYDSSVVHTAFQNHKDIDPVITNYPATTNKQEAAVVQGFTLDTLKATNWPNGKAVNDLPVQKVNGVISPITKKDIVYVMATGLEDVIWKTNRLDCILRGMVGVRPWDKNGAEPDHTNDAECVSLAKIFW